VRDSCASYLLMAFDTLEFRPKVPCKYFIHSVFVLPGCYIARCRGAGHGKPLSGYLQTAKYDIQLPYTFS